MNYEECKKEKINEYLKKYEKGILLNKKKKPITNQRQALAISLSVANSECSKKINDNDIKKLEEKIKRIFYNKKKNLSASIVKDIILLLKYYKNKKKYKKLKVLKIDLLIRVLREVINKKINNIVIQDLIKYLNEE